MNQIRSFPGSCSTISAHKKLSEHHDKNGRTLPHNTRKQEEVVKLLFVNVEIKPTDIRNFITGFFFYFTQGYLCTSLIDLLCQHLLTTLCHISLVPSIKFKSQNTVPSSQTDIHTKIFLHDYS